MDFDLLSKKFEESARIQEEHHDNLLGMLMNVHDVAERSTKHSKILENKIQELDNCNKDKKEIENLLLTCNTENEKSKLLITRIMRSNERLVDERDKLLEIQIQQQQRSNTGVWDFARKSTETSNQKSGINIGKAQDTFTTAQRTKAQTEADKQKAQAEIRRQNQLMAPKLVECLASYFPEFRNPTPENNQQIMILCATIPNFNEEQVTRNYTQLLAAYESLSIEQIQIIDDTKLINDLNGNGYHRGDNVSIRDRLKLVIIHEAFNKMAMHQFGDGYKTDWLTSNIFLDGLYPPRYGGGLLSNMPKLFTNLKGIIECFITLIYSFKPDVDPEILNKLQLLKDNEEKYVIEHLQKKTQGLGITRRKRKSKSNTRKKQIKNRKTKRRINKRKRT